jgi:hypothetical protein
MRFTSSVVQFRKVLFNPNELKNSNIDLVYVWVNKMQGYLQIPYRKYLRAVKEIEDKLKKEAEERERKTAQAGPTTKSHSTKKKFI